MALPLRTIVDRTTILIFVDGKGPIVGKVGDETIAIAWGHEAFEAAFASWLRVKLINFQNELNNEYKPDPKLK